MKVKQRRRARPSDEPVTAFGRSLKFAKANALNAPSVAAFSVAKTGGWGQDAATRECRDWLLTGKTSL